MTAMAMDRAGVWRPLCDISSCKSDVVDDGVIEVDVLVAGAIRTARIQVCAAHLLLCGQRAYEAAGQR